MQTTCCFPVSHSRSSNITTQRFDAMHGICDRGCSAWFPLVHPVLPAGSSIKVVHSLRALTKSPMGDALTLIVGQGS